LTERETNTQTDTAENNTILAARVVISHTIQHALLTCKCTC